MPRFVLPLAGMILSSAMNCVSLASERIHAEIDRGVKYKDAEKTAFNASLIPNPKFSFCCRSCFSTWDDDRTNSFRSVSINLSEVSNNGHVYDF